MTVSKTIFFSKISEGGCVGGPCAVNLEAKSLKL